MKRFALILIFALVVVGACAPDEDEENSESSSTEETTTEETTTTPETVTLSGTGDTATNAFSLELGLTIIRLTHDGSSNFAVLLMNSDSGDRVELVANEIGTFDGSKPIEITTTGNHILDIDSDGNWTASIEQPRPNSAEKKTSFSGTGQQASAFFTMEAGTRIFTITHTGDGHFSVVLRGKSGDYLDVLANEIGNYSGSTAYPNSVENIFIFEIDADQTATWTIGIQ